MKGQRTLVVLTVVNVTVLVVTLATRRPALKQRHASPPRSFTRDCG